ncbi:MAG: hypothetical protein P8X77_15155, partial [Maritimibacter sp.]
MPDPIVPPPITPILATARGIALAAADEVLAGTLATRRTGEIEAIHDDAALDAARALVAQKLPHIFCAGKLIEAVAMATGPVETGMQFERDSFMAGLAHPSGRGMVHAFLAEREVGKIPEAGAIPRAVAKIGVIGGGTMGSGITTAALMA